MKLLKYLALLIISGATLADGISVTPQYTQPSTGTGNVVLQTSPTITSPVISSITNTGTINLPTASTTLVGRSTTDTLTNKLLTYLIEGSVGAAGTTQGTSTLLGSTQNVHIVTSGTLNQGVELPALTGTTGMIEIVRNSTSSTIKLYPDSGSQISGAGTNTAISLAAGQIVGLVASATNTWTFYNVSDFPGTGITMTVSNGINTVAVDNTVVPELSTANTFTNTNTYGTGNLVATSPVFSTFTETTFGGTGISYFGQGSTLVSGGGSTDLALRTDLGSMLFAINSTEKMRMDNAGRLLLGYTSDQGGAQKIQVNGNVFSSGVSYKAANPTISSCGTSPSVDANSSNNAGAVTVGSVSAASCTITFASAFATYNHCRVTSQSSVAAFAYSYTLSAITVTATSMVGDKLDYECDGV